MGVGFDKAVSMIQKDLTEYAKNNSPVAKDQQAEKDKALTGLLEALKDGALTSEEFKAVEARITAVLKEGGKDVEGLAGEVREALFSVLGDSVRKMVTGEPDNDQFNPSTTGKKDSMNKVVEFSVSSSGDKLVVATKIKDAGNNISVTSKVEGGISGFAAGTDVSIGANITLGGKIDTTGKIQAAMRLGPLDVIGTTDTKGNNAGGKLGLGPLSTSITGDKDKTDWKAAFNTRIPGLGLTTSLAAGVTFPNSPLGPSATGKTSPQATLSASLGTDFFKSQGVSLGGSFNVAPGITGATDTRVIGTLVIDDSIFTVKK